MRARDALGLALLVVLGLALRAPLLPVATASYRTTEAFNFEEVENVRISTGMVHESTLNPHAFEYPSLFYSLSALIEAPLRQARGPEWPSYVVAVRSLSLLFGLLAIALTIELARRLGGSAAGWLAGAIVATDRTMIDLSVIAKPNMAQIAFMIAGALALLSLARRPAVRAAALAAACFALAAASKWLGALGLFGVALAAALGAASAHSVPAPRGLSGLGRALVLAARRPISPLALFVPLAVFGLVLLAAMPYALLSPKEFGYGLGQVFFAQGANRRSLPAWISFVYLLQSTGPMGLALYAGGVVWGVRAALRWDGSARSNGILVVFAWVLGYGGLVLFVFARLPSYVDLWLPFLAVLAGLAWAGEQAWLRRPLWRAAAIGVALVFGLIANGAYAHDRARAFERDTRTAAGRWLSENAVARDSLLADLGVFVPDSLSNVRWNSWGTPPRVFYDETKTWGHDPVWPDNWYGGHRRLLFVNARWTPPESLLLARPRYVATTAEWVENRKTSGRSTWRAAAYDRGLEDGSAGYRRAARFAAGEGGLVAGPEIRIYRRDDPVDHTNRSP